MAIKGNILVIDDDLVARDLLEKLFVTGGYHVQTAPDGPDGIKSACTCPPDLVVLDVMMPGLNGFETCVLLKEKFNIPVLLLTAKSSLADLVQGFSSGADDFVKKPYNPKELLLRSKALVRRYHLNSSQ
jgi:DNA-binding response OmpR family regulator